MDIIELAQQLSGATLATLLILILVGGWKKIWVFGYQLTDCEYRTEKMEVDYQERIAKLEATNESWKNIALEATGTLKTSVTLAERRTP